LDPKSLNRPVYGAILWWTYVWSQLNFDSVKHYIDWVNYFSSTRLPEM